MATRYTLARGVQEDLQTIGIQHHHAHIAACMAENGLPGDEPVIGVSFDGTGYGEDDAIWGGEILVSDYMKFERALHLRYIPLPGGDKAVRQPARQALAWLDALDIEWADDFPSVAFLSEQERSLLHQQIKTQVNAPLTSSMGRLFDAVAALAGVRQEVNYEAQAAIEFETLVDPDCRESYPFEIKDEVINPGPMIRAIVADLRANTPTNKIAARFHNTIAQVVLESCTRIRQQEGLSQIALSGGVWQNMVLLTRTYSLLEAANFEVYTHTKVPANDGGLALGQAVIAYHTLSRGSL
jgi:hydrogenase maturation protein HypF